MSTPEVTGGEPPHTALRAKPAGLGATLSVLGATALGVGFLRPAPGTWGSVAAGVAALPILVMAGGQAQAACALLAVLATAVGLASCPGAVRRFGCQDPSQVVIDEVAGVWLGLAVLPSATLTAIPLQSVLAVVVGFRVFDISKPWPINRLERLPGAWGILADDLAAGLVAGILAAAMLH
ncbi:MAG: phosphatidylglycerophosphatase A [Planctomycetes bacterium]|nr:phosphatidylglycerophosphatase A [Planctomycetota bacterium]